MRSRLARYFVAAAALLLPVAAMPAFAEDKKSDGPSLLVRVQSVNDLIKTVEYFLAFAPEDDAEPIKQGLGLVKSLIDDKKGIEGIDVKNPIGLYATITPEVTSSPVVALVPVADEAALLAALKDRAMLDVKKGKDGIYETTPPNSPMTVYFRFANNYAYITANDPENINPKTLPKPADVLTGKASDLLAATVRIDRLPDQMKKLAIGAIENQLAAGKEQPVPNETPAVKEFKGKMIDEVVATIKSVITDGEQVAIKLNVDLQSGEAAFEIEMGGLKGSKLAKDFASIRDNKSVAGGAVLSSDTCFSMNLSVALASSLKKLLPPVIDDAIKEAKKQAKAPGEVEEKLKPLLDALLPTAKAGELDAGFSVVGPNKDGKLTMLAAAKVVDGKKIEATVKALAKDVPPDFANLVALDAEKLEGGSMLHILKVGDFVPADAQKAFGKSDVYLTFRDDLAIIAFGPDGKSAIQKAVLSKPVDVGVFKLEVALARLVPAAADTAEEAANAKKIAKKIFGDSTKSDTVKFSIEGGDTLKIKLSAQGKAIQFLGALGAAKKNKDN
ncbi:hypothetical protein [Zavarzinella formosa]|uniref:hypothetical protein n=1 Tax=Zavarzinella formosa TaxID=360055 RepID=UPI0002F76F98|nr:hypothetical protein [Zavarzinella formosa]